MFKAGIRSIKCLRPPKPSLTICLSSCRAALFSETEQKSFSLRQHWEVKTYCVGGDLRWKVWDAGKAAAHLTVWLFKLLLLPIPSVQYFRVDLVAEDRRVSHKHWQGRPERGGGVEQEEEEADDVQSHPAPRRRGRRECCSEERHWPFYFHWDERREEDDKHDLTGHIFIRMHCSDN